MSSLLRRLTVTSGSVQPNTAISVKFAQQYDTPVAFRGEIVKTCGSGCFRRPPFRLIRRRFLRA
jgi:hypothetical protein